PGFQRPLDALTEHMQRTVDRSFEDVEAVLLVLSARERIGAGDRFVARRVFELGVPVIIVLNKIDRLKGGHIATQMEAASRLGDFHALHPVSAKTGDGVEELRQELVALLPEGPLYFPEEQRTDLPVEVQIAELVREQALRLTKHELPHAITVEVQELGEKVIEADLLVETESQKQIVVGKGGSMVREIGRRARPEIEGVALEERAASRAKRSIKREAKVFALELAVRMMDLTTLEGQDTPGKVAALASKAIRPDPTDAGIPSVAAICIYPNLVPVAVARVKSTSVKVASVATAFPSGQSPIETKLEEVRWVVEQGADEVDMVIDRGAFLSGRYAKVYDEIVQVKEASGDAHLKVILEVAELGTYDNVRRASLLAMAAGADFIK